MKKERRLLVRGLNTILLFCFLLLTTGREQISAQIVTIDIKNFVYQGMDGFATLHFRDAFRVPVTPVRFNYQVNDIKTSRLLLSSVVRVPASPDPVILVPASANIIVNRALPADQDELHTITGLFVWYAVSPITGQSTTYQAPFKATFPVRKLAFVPPTIIVSTPTPLPPTSTITATPTITQTPTATASPSPTAT